MTAIRIEQLGLHGDGLAGQRFYPLTLPGDLIDGTSLDLIEPSAHRIEPACRHFGTCGGCALQHASDGFVADWKTGVVQKALKAHGLEAEFLPVATSPPKSRRRAGFAGRRTKKSVQIGFHARGSDHLVPLAECTVLHPDLFVVIPALEALTRLAASRKGVISLVATLSEAGIDLDVTGAKPLDVNLRSAVAALAETHDLARLSWEGEAVVTRRPPAQSFAGHRVVPPPGAFLQATKDGENALISAVMRGVEGASLAGDLFCGCGTFTLPMASRTEVAAFEGLAPQVEALKGAWRQGTGLKRVEATMRDLFKRPVLRSEMKHWDAVVIDPPRAGAEAQCGEIAGSDIGRVISVSCNPVTFARDAHVLTKAGFNLDWVQIVDQFRWSPHVEIAARLSR